MRKFTLIWLGLAALVGNFLFHTSQDVQKTSHDLKSIYQKIAEEEETIRVLKAEWSYLNQPERLETLAETHLKIDPLTGERILDTQTAADILTAPPVVKPVRKANFKQTNGPSRKQIQKPKTVIPEIPAEQPGLIAPVVTRKNRRAEDFTSMMGRLDH